MGNYDNDNKAVTSLVILAILIVAAIFVIL